MAFVADQPYNALPLLPPEADVETKAILRKTIAAGRALAELKGLGETIPDQAILINSLLLQEAKASSEIENILTTNDALFRAFTAGTVTVDPATKEVLRYREALWAGFTALQARPVLTTNLCIQIVQTIKEHTGGIRTLPGTAIANQTTGEVLYTPPDGEERIRGLLKNLEDYMHAEDAIDPLIKLALIHYQFEAIHPFADGNGRTGRILIMLYLVLTGLLDQPVLYLSRYIIDHKNDYYRLLRQVTTDQAWEPWICYMLDAVEETARFTRQRILAIRTLMLDTMQQARELLPSRVYSKELMELLFRQPYVKGQFLVEAGIAERKTAANYLQELEKIGIVQRKKMGKEVLYLNTRLFALLSR
ncbi:MAG: Adenosine monophosphate-protein transferase SoFic [bacterium ADurb.Bin429]|nr:MAG: Adenosine monophosphate-protein transferase SoFic [bacterium ADurb.Bin429]